LCPLHRNDVLVDLLALTLQLAADRKGAPLTTELNS
jgi:hypothetical protein